MQSTGQTSIQASQPVQLSALTTANSLGSFLRALPAPFAMMTLDSNNSVRWNSLILASRPHNASALCADQHTSAPSCHNSTDILDRKLQNVQSFPQLRMS